MKKIISVLCALALLLSLSSCGGGNPETVVRTCCSAFRKLDLDTVNECLLEPFEAAQEETDELPEEITDLICANMKLIRFKVVDSEQSGDSAVVTVHFSFPDLAPAVLATAGELLIESFSMAMHDASPDEVIDFVTETMLRYCAENPPEITECDGSFFCVKTKEGWKISDADDAVADALTGNMLSAIEDALSTLNELFS